MEVNVNHIRETMQMCNKAIPLMNKEEILKINEVLLELFDRLAKEGRIREE